MKPINLEERILVLAPTGQDAELTIAFLNRAGFQAQTCRDIYDLAHRAEEGCGAIAIAEEALGSSSVQVLVDLFSKQPSWSDLPITIITSGAEATEGTMRRLTVFGPTGNVTFLERPFRPLTLINSMQAALRSRRRQYQVRDLIKELKGAKEQITHYATNLERTVAERTARLEETVSELEAFSYSVSHDLRAPLRAMQNYSQFLLEDFADKLNGEGKEYINRIINASSRLDRLIQDILTYSRATRGEITIQSIEPERLIADIIDHYPTLQEPRAHVIVQSPLLQVAAHEASLTQCISNLLVNAAKFVQQDVVPEVKIWTEINGSQVRINFQDNGIGIDSHYLSRIFKMFERAPRASGYDGTGIGLAIVRKAVERMGGSVGVESELNKGSKFWIQLPKG